MHVEYHNTSTYANPELRDFQISTIQLLCEDQIGEIGNEIDGVDLARQIVIPLCLGVPSLHLRDLDLWEEMIDHPIVDSNDFQELLDSHNQEPIMDKLVEMYGQDIEELESLDSAQSEAQITVGNLEKASI
ncbi:hypothetical protein TNCV_3154831 [Trichonephila clavipes]|nr:hypothetical protein TNCV_3154831 [Trichonephila clavipes]